MAFPNTHGMGFTDIRLDLLSKLPPAARPYALLMRLDRPVGWWLLLLPGWWAIMLAGDGVNGLGWRGWYLMVLFLIGSVVMRGAGCIVNDLWDRDLDARVERTRTRPLASGLIKPWHAVFFLAALLLAGFGILIQLPVASMAFGFVSLVFVVSYPYMKRITWWPQAFLGLTFNFGVPIGWTAVTGGQIHIAALLMYAGAFFWTLGYDTIYAHQDKTDDQMVGIKSTALLFGVRSKKWVGIFYAIAWSLIGLSAFVMNASILSLGFLLFPGVHMLLQVLLWKPDDPRSSLRWFKSNRDCGLLFLLCFLCA